MVKKPVFIFFLLAHPVLLERYSGFRDGSAAAGERKDCIGVLER